MLLLSVLQLEITDSTKPQQFYTTEKRTICCALNSPAY